MRVRFYTAQQDHRADLVERKVSRNMLVASWLNGVLQRGSPNGTGNGE